MRITVNREQWEESDKAHAGTLNDEKYYKFNCPKLNDTLYESLDLKGLLML